jgi:hypothetical protein
MTIPILDTVTTSAELAGIRARISLQRLLDHYAWPASRMPRITGRRVCRASQPFYSRGLNV